MVDLRPTAFKILEHRSISLLINHLFPDLTSMRTTGEKSGLLLDEGWLLIEYLRRDYQYFGNAVVRLITGLGGQI
jgi:hypothetical protein